LGPENRGGMNRRNGAKLAVCLLVLCAFLVAWWVPVGKLAITSSIQTSSGCGQTTESMPSRLACASEPAPGDGLGEAQAVAAARRIAPPSSVTPIVVWAFASRYSLASDKGTVSGDRWVWMVDLEGAFAASSCPASGTSTRPCGPAAGTQLIILDYYSGDFIESSAD
jgi:hypothetical protein